MQIGNTAHSPLTKVSAPLLTSYEGSLMMLLPLITSKQIFIVEMMEFALPVTSAMLQALPKWSHVILIRCAFEFS